MSGKSQIRFWLLAGLVFVLTASVLCLFLLGLGSMQGLEFSPDDFSSRSFSYTRLPWFEWVVSGLRYVDQSNSLQKSLVADGWITVKQAAPRTWHLVGDRFQDPVSPDYDAQYLVRYLAYQAEWQDFNNRQAEKAKLFWPRVAQLARDEMYLYLPPIMQLGLEEPVDGSLELFKTRLRDLATEAYRSRARIRREQQRLEEADRDEQRALDLPAETPLGRAPSPPSSLGQVTSADESSQP